MKHLLKLALIGAAAFQSACSIMPGMRNDVDNGSADEVEIVSITPQLIAEDIGRQRASDGAGLPEALQPVSAGAVGYQYRVGPGDVLTIIVWDHPELTMPMGQTGDPASAGRLIARDGTMFYPNVGTFQAAGKTLAEVRTHLTRELARVIREPQVDVRVAAYRSQRVYLTGQIAQPGVIFLDDEPKGILDAINERGGLTPTANRTSVTLSRGGESYALDLAALYARGQQGFNVMLKPGDVIHVGDAAGQKVFMLGELNREQTLPIVDGRMSLAEALSTAGGLQTTSANPRAIFVFRAPVSADAPKPRVYAMDLTRADSLILAEQFSLQPRDVVYVASTDFSKYNRVIGQLLPTISSVFQIDRLTSDR